MTSNTQAPKPSIRFRQVGKSYALYDSPAKRLMDMLFNSRKPDREFWAMRGASLDIMPGEVVGLVGKNGAGKSTFLQMACGTLTPSEGSIEVNGRVAALLELGAGFNPEFTGRENIYLNAPLFGLTANQVESRIDEIIDFAGIGRFVDLPVKTYSSGMFVRLAFSLATAVDPDILVIDEALSVGDGEFARRSFDRIMALKDRGATILFCSHSPFQVESLCKRALWIDKGCIRMDGDVSDVVSAYRDFVDLEVSARKASKNNKLQLQTEGFQASEGGRAGLVAARAAVISPEDAELIQSGAEVQPAWGKELVLQSQQDSLLIEAEFEFDEGTALPQLAFEIAQPDGRIIATAGAWADGVQSSTFPSNKPGITRGKSSVIFDKLSLLKGQYAIGAYLFCEKGIFQYSAGRGFAVLKVEQSSMLQGVVALPHRWQANGVNCAAATGVASESTPSPVASTKTTDWVLRDYLDSDYDSVRELFQTAFGQVFNDAVWQWKYQWAYQDPGRLINRPDGKVIAFFGGMKRAMVNNDRTFYGVQVGDCMTDPKERAAFTKKGALYRVASTYCDRLNKFENEAAFDAYAGAAHLFLFGFPSDRHMQVGVRTGMYERYRPVQNAIWAAEAAKGDYRFTLRAVPGKRLKRYVDDLFLQMRASLPNRTFGVRDWAWIKTRYIDHPVHQYVFLEYKSRLRTKPDFVVVLRVKADHVEWTDFIGPVSQFDQAAKQIKRYAHSIGKPNVVGWFLDTMLDVFKEQKPHTSPANIEIAISPLFLSSEFGLQMARQLWLMMGDSDFK